MKRRCISCSFCFLSRCGAPDTNFVDFVGAADFVLIFLDFRIDSLNVGMGREQIKKNVVLYTKRGVEEKQTDFTAVSIGDLSSQKATKHHMIMSQHIKEKTTVKLNLIAIEVHLNFLCQENSIQFSNKARFQKYIKFQTSAQRCVLPVFFLVDLLLWQ